MPRPYDTPPLFCLTLCSGHSKFNGTLCGCCCPCVVYSRNRYRNLKGNADGFHSCNGHCVGWCGLCLLGHWGWILQCMTRADMQEKHNLEGNGCTNCLLSCCCSCSEVIQTSKELDFIRMMQDVSSANEAQNKPPAAATDGYKMIQGDMIAEPQSNPILEAPSPQP